MRKRRQTEELSKDLEEFIESIMQDTYVVQDKEDIEELILAKNIESNNKLRIKVFIFININRSLYFFTVLVPLKFSKDIIFCNKIFSIMQTKMKY